MENNFKYEDYRFYDKKITWDTSIYFFSFAYL